jgi:hypothetical protein
VCGIHLLHPWNWLNEWWCSSILLVTSWKFQTLQEVMCLAACDISLTHSQSGQYTGEPAWKSIEDRLQGPCYPSRDYHDHKIWAWKQITDIGKYSFINRTIKFWNQLPAQALATFPVNHLSLERGLRKQL